MKKGIMGKLPPMMGGGFNPGPGFPPGFPR